MSTVLSPTAPVRFAIYRLRQSVAETSRFTDEDLRLFINDGYQSACERTACLPAITTLTVVAGTTEVALPADWARTLHVYQNGHELGTVSYQNALRVPAGSYYQYEGTIGLTGSAPTVDATLYILYARTPAPLGLDDVPEWGGEWNYLLRHYAAWRCMSSASGAQDRPWIVNERAFYDVGVQQLRASTNRSLKAAPRVVRTVAGAC
jgi:hypothetical protein